MLHNQQCIYQLRAVLQSSYANIVLHATLHFVERRWTKRRKSKAKVFQPMMADLPKNI